MHLQLDYRNILPRQTSDPVVDPGATSIQFGSATVVDIITTATSLSGLSVAGTDGSESLLSSSPSLPITGSLSAASVSPTESEAAAPQSIPTRTLAAICVAAGVLLGGVIIFALWWDRSKKKVPEQPSVEGSYSQDAPTQDMKLRGLHAAPPPPINSLRRPSTGNTTYDHGYKGGYDLDTKQSFDAALLPAIQDDSFLSFKSTGFDTSRPQTAPPGTPPQSVPQSPRSASAQPITHPYSVGSHPYASPSILHGPLYRPSFERTATSTTAIAAPDLSPSARLGSSTPVFAGAGARPGYDAYGFESRTAGATSSNNHGSITNRPSIESIRSVARKASQSNFPGEPTYPPTGGSTRTRNNSTSTYAGSVRAGKVKPTKEEKAKELAAMDNLIAALDENAEAERRRKQRLVAAAGIVEDPPNTSKKSAGNSRRKDTTVTGSYPLPPAEVFRAALSRGRAEDEPDDDEIARWRRN